MKLTVCPMCKEYISTSRLEMFFHKLFCFENGYGMD